MKIETVCLAGQHSRPWGILIDGKLDCDIPRCAYENGAVFQALLKYPNEVVYTTKSPEHYSNQP